MSMSKKDFIALADANGSTKHTPGPWVVKSTDEDINTKTIIDSNEFWIAKVLNFNHASDDIGESRANANLIAAAPAMYEALSQVQAFIQTLVEADVLAYPTKLTDAVELALAQAEGKQGEAQANAALIAAAPAMYQELVKQRDWLLHVMKQVQAPASVMLGFEQSIKYLNLTIAQAEGK